MKKLLIILILISGMCALFAEEVKVKTGDIFGTSVYDYFTPVARGIRGGATCVSSIKKIEKDLWCITLVVESRSGQLPKYFEYYVKTGDVITVCRFPNIETEVQLKVKSVGWNEAVLEVME